MTVLRKNRSSKEAEEKNNDNNYTEKHEEDTENHRGNRGIIISVKQLLKIKQTQNTMATLRENKSRRDAKKNKEISVLQWI